MNGDVVALALVCLVLGLCLGLQLGAMKDNSLHLALRLKGQIETVETARGTDHLDKHAHTHRTVFLDIDDGLPLPSPLIKTAVNSILGVFHPPPLRFSQAPQRNREARNCEECERRRHEEAQARQATWGAQPAPDGDTARLEPRERVPGA